jgi:hypothetical protein
MYNQRNRTDQPNSNNHGSETIGMQYITEYALHVRAIVHFRGPIRRDSIRLVVGPRRNVIGTGIQEMPHYFRL